jgi:hypothetical protein
MERREYLDHLERYLGTFLRARPVENDGGRDLGYGIFIYESPSMVTAVTEGVRSHTPQSPLPLELACSVRPGQADGAEQLMEWFSRIVVSNGADLEYDDGLLVEDPLVPGTEIRGLLAAPHPYADEMVNLVRGADGRLELQIITLVPITGPEGRYLTDHETGDLFDLWTSAGTDLLDLHRSSAV